MHIADQDTGNFGANAIVGGSAGIATGAAMSIKMRGSDQVAACFFGDGALGQGLLYETMNMASLWKLPVLYVCENNQYNEYTHFSETTAGEVTSRATAFGIHTESVDGQDVDRSRRRQKLAEQGGGAAPAFWNVSPTASTAATSAASTARTTALKKRRSGRVSATR
jgi:pyruvate dehydrogenase E1 component alpha subunit